MDDHGPTIGSYRITAEIGRGGMSTVYRAVQTSIGRDVAVKVLLGSLMSQDATFLDRFYREVQINANLQHPHIMPVYDFGVHQGQPYIVMAFLRGGSLADLIRQGPMVLPEAGRILSEVAEALDFAHSHGVIHRDFKPSNVMLDEQGNTYLTDFGLARASDVTSQLTGSRIMGTPDYMAPDLVREDGVTRSVDVYALGVTLYQMLAGHVPFKASTPMGVLMAHISQPVPDIRAERPDLNDAIQQAISTAMAKDPEERFPTAGDMAKAFRAAVQQPHGSVQPVLFIDKSGNVIFANGHLLSLLQIQEADTRDILGQPMHAVLGIAPEIAEQVVLDVAKIGHAYRQSLELRSRDGNAVRVSCSATATYDEKGKVIGADLTLHQLPVVVPRSRSVAVGEPTVDTGDKALLQVYFTSHLDALRALVIRVGGLKLGNTLERIVHETSQRNQWPVRFEGGKISIDSPRVEPYIYHGLLTKATSYAVGVIGPEVVERQASAVDGQMGERALQLAGRLGLRDIFVRRF